MKFLVAAVLAGLAMAAQEDLACPTVTKSALEPRCTNACANADCMFVSTIANPCGCPASIPTATLLYPCGASCPYNGCGVEFRAQQLPCPVPTTSTSTRRRKKHKTTTSSTTSSTPKVVVTVTYLTPTPKPTPPPPTPTCPTVTKTTMPADCPAMRCPVPDCIINETVSMPCGCDAPHTLLYVQGCRTACPAGCMTRTSTAKQACATAS